jgi:bifunctional DNA-binding transcriptional regulator/antitoxin component of YhaV-PrlF toxin-antitoxin module
MCNGKPVYKLIDGKGRVLIPKDLRSAAGMDYGDIVRLGVTNGRVSIRKIDIIEAGQAKPALKPRVGICKISLRCCSRRGHCGNREQKIYRRELPARAPRQKKEV